MGLWPKSRIAAWTAAVIFGAAAPAIITALFSGLSILPVAFVITLAHAVVLGLPVALIYQRKRWVGLRRVLAGGFAIGMAPIALIALPSLFVGSASVDNIPTVVGGVPTLFGMLEYLLLPGMAGALGATGALAFWLTLRWLGEFERPIGAQVEWRSAGIRSLIALVVAALVAIGITAIPSITKDRTCHNLFRDGRRTVTPQVQFDLDITVQDWPKLAQLLQAFGKSHGMSFRNQSSSKAGDFDGLSVSVCNEQGQVVDTEDLHWVSKAIDPPRFGRGVAVGIYDLNGGSAWRSMSQELAAAMNRQWPGRVRYQDQNGALVKEPPPYPNRPVT